MMGSPELGSSVSVGAIGETTAGDVRLCVVERSGFDVGLMLTSEKELGRKGGNWGALAGRRIS